MCLVFQTPKSASAHDAIPIPLKIVPKRVRELIFENVASVKFFAPDVAYADARKYLPALLEKRGVDGAAAMLEVVAQGVSAAEGRAA